MFKITKKKLYILLSIMGIICVGTLINYTFFKPTKLNYFIASKIYKAPANTAFTDDNFYKCVVDAYNRENSPDIAYTDNLTDKQLQTITGLTCNTSNIISVSGLEKLTSLTYLNLYLNKITKLDVGNPKLEKLYIRCDNNITSLNLKNLLNLTVFHLTGGAGKIIDIDLSKNTKLKELNLENVEKLNNLKLYPDNLESFKLTGTSGLENLDLTAATKLTRMTIEVGGKSFLGTNEYKFDVGTVLDVHKYNFQNNSLKLPSQFSSLPYYSTVDLLIDSYGDPISPIRNDNHTYTLDRPGQHHITESFYEDTTNMRNGNMYQINHKINVIGIGSYYTAYKINHEKNYIYVSDRKQFNISYITSYGCEIEQVGNKLNVYVDGKLYKQYDIISWNQRYDIHDKSIYLGNQELNVNDIVNFPAVAENDGLTLKIKIDGEIIDTYSLIGFTTTYGSGSNYLYVGTDVFDIGKYENSSKINIYSEDGKAYGEIIDSNNNKIFRIYYLNRHWDYYLISNYSSMYDLTKKYIFVGNNNLQLSEITVSYATKKIEEEKLLIVYKGEVINEFDIVSFDSEEYDLTNDYIYLGTEELNLNKINVVNATKILENNKLLIKYEDELIKSFDIINVMSDIYEINAEFGYIYTGTDVDSKTILNNINLSFGEASIEDNKLLIKYEDEIIKTFEIINISSDKYDINEEKGYIYTKTDIESDIILNNVNINGEVSIENNKLLIKYNGKLIKSFDIINISSDKYDVNIDKGYIHTKIETDSEAILSNINLNNGEVSIEDNKLLIKYNNELVTSFDVVNVSSDKYDLTKEYIYVGSNEFEIDDISGTNVNIEEKENSLFIKYQEELIVSLPILKLNSDVYEVTDSYVHSTTGLIDLNNFVYNDIELEHLETIEGNYLIVKYENQEVTRLLEIVYTSEDYKLTNEFIYLGTSKLNMNLINKTAGFDMVEENNLLNIKYENEIVREIKLITVSSDEYKLLDQNIYTGTKEFDITKLNVVNANSRLILNNQRVSISFDGIRVKSYVISTINFGELEINNNKIMLFEEMPYENFISNVIATGITYKIYNGEEEVTTGNITPGMKLRVYVGEELVDTYKITDEYLEISDNLSVNETTGMIENLIVGQTVEWIKENIDTTGIVKVVDQENNEVTGVVGTGYKVVIELGNETIEYTLVVSGDITGDGEIKMSDVMKVANQLLNENTILGDCYLKAADVTGDGKIKMSDVMKLANYIIEGGNL